MNIEDDIFKKMVPDYKKLIDFGFEKKNDIYFYKKKLVDNFEAIITVSDNVSGKIIDLDFNEEYINFRLENQTGEFIGKIREKYIFLLEKIKKNCFIKRPFVSEQANRISNLILEKYNLEPIFKWENNECGVFENNKKWFALIMNINRNKFSDLTGEVDVLNVKLNSNEIINLLNENGFYKAYHMNKKNWIMITLDDTLDDIKIMDLIDKSYSYTVTFKGSPNEWVMPINPGFFDIWTYFDGTDTYYWDKKKSFKVGDTIYLYITKPFGCIMYKCLVYDFTDDFMIIKKICKYDEGKYNLDLLRKYGLTSVRSTRHVPLKLSEYLKRSRL